MQGRLCEPKVTLGPEALKVKVGGQLMGHGGVVAMAADNPCFRRQGVGQFFKRGG